MRIWDCFLVEGSKLLFRYACALLKINKKVLMEQTDAISFFKHLKHAVKHCFDVKGLTKV